MLFSQEIFVACVILSWSYCLSAATISSTLQQLHVIFRHGDRTPDAVSMYPNDPHLNDTWYPDGLGELTKLGKTQEYKIGQFLRKRYDDFLGNIYTPDVLDAWSTDYNRTKMSMLLVLAGLWPPPPSQLWNNMLPWLPIPYNYHPQGQDKLLGFPILFCPKFKTQFVQIAEVKEFKDFLINNRDLVEYININSGLNVQTMFDLFSLYFGLYAEEKTGRKLPKWTRKVYPEFLETASILCYEMQTYSNSMRQACGGQMIQKVISNAQLKMNGTLNPEGRKIFLYSAHEYNIAHILAALNLFKPHIPPYASYIIFELHKISDVYGLKIFYQDYAQLNPSLLTIPECNSFCPIDKFIDLTQSVIPVNDTC